MAKSTKSCGCSIAKHETSQTSPIPSLWTAPRANFTSQILVILEVKTSEMNGEWTRNGKWTEPVFKNRWRRLANATHCENSIVFVVWGSHGIAPFSHFSQKHPQRTEWCTFGRASARPVQRLNLSPQFTASTQNHQMMPHDSTTYDRLRWMFCIPFGHLGLPEALGKACHFEGLRRLRAVPNGLQPPRFLWPCGDPNLWTISSRGRAQAGPDFWFPKISLLVKVS